MQRRSPQEINCGGKGMMKFIHCADVHLGGKSDSAFPKELADEIKADLRTAFKDMVSYAEKSGIRVILLCGDVFDSDRPFKKDKDFFYSVVRGNPDIEFLYLKGNHDVGENLDEELPNLKRFSDKWTVYDLGGVKFHGIEMTRENSSSLYSTFGGKAEDFNVVMMHGQKGGGKDCVNLMKFRDKNIDYLALGHLHTFGAEKIDERGVAVYSGCLSGRGFDETGEKGFVEVTVDGGRAEYEFKPFSERVIREETVDVSGLKDAYEIVSLIKSKIKADVKAVVKITLCGELDYLADGLSYDVKRYLGGTFAYAEVKDKTSLKLDISALSHDNSLIGEFLRCVDGSDYPEEDKAKIIAYGIRALKGERID